jgi:hypothetical protein
MKLHKKAVNKFGRSLVETPDFKYMYSIRGFMMFVTKPKRIYTIVLKISWGLYKLQYEVLTLT